MGAAPGSARRPARPQPNTHIPPATAPMLCLQIWIIVYGQMQSWTPQLILGPLKQAPPNKWVAALWCGILTVVPLSLGIVMLAGGGLACQRCLPASARWPALHACMPAGCALFVPCLHHTAVPLMETSLPCLACPSHVDTFGPGVPEAPAAVAITVVLYAFCLVFAVNSAVHSYLIVAYASGDKARAAAGSGAAAPGWHWGWPCQGWLGAAAPCSGQGGNSQQMGQWPTVTVHS